MKGEKIENIVWIIFGIVGVLFLSVAIFLNYWAIIPQTNRGETIATIIEIEYRDNNDEYPDVLVSYEVNGQQYRTSLDSYSSSYYEGKEITIYYDKNDPSKIMDNTPKILMYVFGGIGIAFLSVAVIINLFKLRNKRMKKNLRETGNIVNAKYISCYMNTNYTVNNKHPYKIVCEWVNNIDNKVYRFKSKNIWVNPEKYIVKNNIKSFRVYIDPNNLKKYYVDVDMLLENITRSMQ